MQRNIITKTVLPDVKKIIMVTSGKGGVGKSTIAAGLSINLVRKGFKVGLLDADIFGPSIPTLFNIGDDERPMLSERDGKQRIEPLERNTLKIMSIGFFFDQDQAVVWRGPMVTNAIKQLMTETDWGELDYLIIDTPPGTGDVLITLLQSFAISGVLVVTTPQLMALADVQKAITMLSDQKIGAPILGIVENMSWFTPLLHSDEKYYLFGKGGAKKLSEQFDLPVLAQIPVNETICGDCDSGDLIKMFDDEMLRLSFDQLTKCLVG